MKVKNLCNKNQFIMEDDKKIIFQSYDSIIAIYNKKKETIILGKNWNYSNTTRKHLYIFIDQELPLNENTKELINTKYTNNRKKSIQELIDNKKINYKKRMM